ncbi:hypothetical protein R1L06_07915 [Stenotrophomonas sp. C4297]|uniref:hypothetical protein n=1 Tax=Stenotrophomonas sp. C4297 TaxID=3077847 RepID=UPI00293C9DB1|nr:hypothetical protein [Stenotrophomonas sp. C4297]MDV3510647.1 hypothetical protein [Stenotrophomonas sp. C4297]
MTQTTDAWPESRINTIGAWGVALVLLQDSWITRGGVRSSADSLHPPSAVVATRTDTSDGRSRILIVVIARS